MPSQKQNILIVEDDLGVGILEKRRLERLGYGVTLATTIDEARTIWKKGNWDLILVDYQLDNGRTGLDFAEEIQIIGSQTPVILATGFKSEDKVLRAFRCGVRDFVEKSDSFLEDLGSSVTRILHQAKEQNELVESRSLLNMFFDSMDDQIIILLDKSGRIKKVNSSFCKILGYETDDYIGGSHSILYTQKDLEEGLPEKLLVSVRENRKLEHEGWMLRRDGTQIWSQSVIHPVRNSEGQLEGFGLLIRDLTEIKKSRDELRVKSEELLESEKRFQNLAEAAPVGIFQFDESGRILYANQAWASIMGRSIEEVMNRDWRDFLHPDCHSEVIRDWKEKIASRKTIFIEYRIVAPDQGTKWVMTHGVPVKNHGEDLLFYIGTLTDITERKNWEIKLRELNSVLEKRVEERTQALEIANTELAKSSRLKDEFLACMSHELRTPLNGILGLSDAMKVGVFGPLHSKQVSPLEDIEQCGRHLLALINDILDISKIEAGEVSLVFSKILIGDLAQSALRFVRELAQKKRMKVHSRIDESVIEIIADELRLKQILVNLLGNAVKFTPESGSIGLDISPDEKSDGIRFTVWDTGIGISRLNVDKLFKPFQQVDGGLDRSFGGTGLGLALVKRLTELHGGSVSMESEPGKGSRFHIVLPWKSIDAASLPLDSIPVREVGVCKVMIINENALDSKQISNCLSFLDLECLEFSSISGAIEQIGKIQPGLILLDLRISGGAGFDLLMWLKNDTKLSTIPLIATSSNQADCSRAIELGADSCVLKPITFEALVASLPPNLLKCQLFNLKNNDWNMDTIQKSLVLLAEDNDINARLARDYLQSIGYRVEVAKDGFQAVEMARRYAPKLILMDIQMPGIDGLEAMRLLRADPATEKIPMVAMTALAMPGDKEKCLEAGADKYISKPVSLNKLRTVVQDLVPQ